MNFLLTFSKSVILVSWIQRHSWGFVDGVSDSFIMDQQYLSVNFTSYNYGVMSSRNSIIALNIQLNPNKIFPE